MKSARPFALMVKPAGSVCNMRCRYCYYIDNQSSDRSLMSEELLETTIRNYFESASYPLVSFIWHGGEPTLRGIDFYRKAVGLQKKYLPQGFECWNNLQTNGLSLNEEWCAFLKANHFDVGISVDGTKLIHDTYRSDASGNPTYERIRRNIQLLQRHGIRPDLLCTVTEDTAKNPLRVYDSLKSFRTGWIQFIAIVNHDGHGGVSEESVKPQTYGKFLCALFRQWVLKDLGKADIQMFIELLNVYHGGSASVCWMQETCGQALVVESNGNIYSCDHFVNEDHLLGNVRNVCLSDTLQSDLQNAFGLSKKDALSQKCISCPWLKLCHGGCLKDRIKNDHENWLCEGLAMFFAYADPVYRRIDELLGEKKKTEEIRQIIRKEGLL